MIIDRKTSPFLIYSEDPLILALQKISENKSGFVVAVSEKGRAVGVLTDGDVRRWLSSADKLDLNVPVGLVANREFVTLPITASPEEIAARLDSRVRVIPLTDEAGHLIAIARQGQDQFRIGARKIGDAEPAYIIAEIGNNHNGDVELAKRLVDIAVSAGADCAKFQMRDMEALYGSGRGTAGASHDLGAQYTLDLLAKYNLDRDDMFRLFDHCRAVGIEPLCTPWDEPSLDALESYGLEGYKVASADLTNHGFMTVLAETGKPLICSTGMATEIEIVDTVRLLRANSASYALLHCNSTYPTPYKDVNLRYIPRLAKIGDCTVGYSGHERGWIVPLAAIAFGARIIEKHISVDRSMEGNDHKVSLLPDELAEMVRSIRSIEEATGQPAERELTQGEMMNREVLAKSLYAGSAIEAGTVITDDLIEVRSPGQGLQPNYRAELVGRRANRTIAPGTPFFPTDLEDVDVSARDFQFDRPWGIPVRWHDYREILDVSNPDLLEYHLSYKDMEEPLEDWFDDILDIDLTVHAPELFSGDHILDLASEDEAYRSRSIRELQRVCDLTRKLAAWHGKSGTPLIIANLGGFTTSGFRPLSERTRLYALIEDSLGQIDSTGVEIIPQTMPPFPWHFGGQSHHNLFVDPDEIADFCARTGMRVCFDISHSQLACNHFKWSMIDFTRKIGPHTAHLHIADAKGIDGEGLQVGDGTMDLKPICDVLNETCPEASFVPEVWQGHKNNGAGFWYALNKLEPWLGRASDTGS